MSAAAPQEPIKEPGFWTVLSDMFKSTLGCAGVGIAIGAIAGLLAQTVFNVPVANVVMQATPEASLLASAVNGAALGMLAGGCIGLPVGCMQGVNEIKDFYKNIAIPKERKVAESKGKALGAALEHQANELQVASQIYRNQIGSGVPGSQVTSSNGGAIDLATLDPNHMARA